MILRLIYFAPCLMAVFWLFIYIFKMKNLRQQLFTALMALSAFYYAAYGIYLLPEQEDYHTLVVMDSISMPVILLVLSAFVLYLRILKTKRQPHYGYNLLMVPAIVIGTMVDLLYYLIGYDNAAEMARLFEHSMPYPDEFKTEIFWLYGKMVDKVVGYAAIFYMAFIIYQCIDILRINGYTPRDTWNFFFKGKTTTSLRAIAWLVIMHMLLMMPLALAGRKYQMEHPALAVTLTLLVAFNMFCLYYVEYFSDNRTTITLRDLSNIEPHGKVKEEAALDFADPAQRRSILSLKQDKHVEQLRSLFDEEQIYKDNDLSIATLSERMGIGRTTLSALVKLTYNMSFRDIVSHYRIEAVKEYMLSHPTDTQEVVAQECGFKSSSYMNTKFKEVTGETPSMWLACHSV